MSDDPKVTHVLFGRRGFLQWADQSRILGLDEEETQEILALLKEHEGHNPHHSPRYRQLWAKYDRAMAKKLAGEIASKLDGRDEH